MTKNFTVAAAQGDVHFTRIDALPKGLTETKPTTGRLIVTHSETGHHHEMAVLDRAKPAVQMFTGADPLVAWLQVNRPTALEHMRPHDTHEPIMFQPGVYEIRRQREYDPMEKIARRVED